MRDCVNAAICRKANETIKKQRDLLEECERAFEFIQQDDCGCQECELAREMLAKLRAAQEKADE